MLRVIFWMGEKVCGRKWERGGEREGERYMTDVNLNCQPSFREQNRLPCVPDKSD